MTILVAREDYNGEGIWLGADRQVCYGDVRATEMCKIFRFNSASFAFAGALGDIQAILSFMRELKEELPTFEKKEDMFTFADLLRGEFLGRPTPDEDGIFSASIMIVAPCGIYLIDPDFSMIEPPKWGCALGSGEREARAILYAFKNHTDTEKIIKKAMKMTSDLVTSVGSKFDMQFVPYKGEN